MASDILQKILDAEKQTGSDISSAQQKADKILLDNEAELEKFKTEIAGKSKEYVEKLIADTESETADKEAEMLKVNREKAKAYVEKRMSKRSEAIEAVIKALI